MNPLVRAKHLNTYCNNGHTEKRSRTEETENFIVVPPFLRPSPFLRVTPQLNDAGAATDHADLVGFGMKSYEIPSLGTDCAFARYRRLVILS